MERGILGRRVVYFGEEEWDAVKLQVGTIWLLWSEQQTVLQLENPILRN